MMALPESGGDRAVRPAQVRTDVGPLLIPEDPDQRALASLITRVHDVYIAPVQGCMYRGPMPVEKRAEDLQTVKKQMDVVERVFADAARTRRPQSQSLKSGKRRPRRRSVRLRVTAVLRGRRVVPDVRLSRTHLASLLRLGRRLRRSGRGRKSGSTRCAPTRAAKECSARFEPGSTTGTTPGAGKPRACSRR